METIFAAPVSTIDGIKKDLTEYQGKVLLIVNVASQCGLTPQYKGLQDLYDQYHGKGFEILGFPCNDFAQQEPGNENEIAEFCKTRFAVTFPLFGKINILGEKAHPLYRILQNAQLPLITPGDFKSILFNVIKLIVYLLKGMGLPMKNAVQWNFQKFLIDKNGHPVANFASQTDPLDLRLTSRIEEELFAPPG
ncbi:MAG: glutathione peroxidase [Nitrospinota bacterium]|nr:glutathione peroxidase [Nitrospinota bacterium]